MAIDLPTELKLDICQTCDRDVVARLCRISNSWRACGERILYRDIDLAFDSSIPSHWEMALSALRYLHGHPELASAVVSLRVSVKSQYICTACETCRASGSCNDAYGLPTPLDCLAEFSKGAPEREHTPSTNELLTLAAYKPFSCRNRLHDNYIILWALLSLVLSKTSRLEVLELPTVVPAGGLHDSTMRAVSLLNRLRQIQLPQICVSSFTDHLGDALSASPGARRPLVAGVECTQRGQDVKPNTSLTTFPGILPLVIESRNVRLMPYIAEDDTALTAYLGLVQPLLVDLAQRDLAGRRCDPFRSGIAFQIHLTVWQAARISELIELLPNALREHVISVELKFVTQAFDHAPIPVAPVAAEGDMDSEVPTSPRFTADEIVDAVLCLPALRSLWVDEVSETWAERVMLFTEHEVVRAARSKGLGQFRFVRFQGLPR